MITHYYNYTYVNFNYNNMSYNYVNYYYNYANRNYDNYNDNYVNYNLLISITMLAAHFHILKQRFILYQTAWHTERECGKHKFIYI